MKKILRSLYHRVNNFIDKIKVKVGRSFVKHTAPIWVKILKNFATTGSETDLCLEQGFLPMPVHFYSPVPDIEDLNRRQVWRKKSELIGIDFQPNNQVKLLSELGEKFGNECNWPGKPIDSDSCEFYTENTSFSFGCAAGLHSILRFYKPHRVIEIGSGFSSLIISSTLAINRSEGDPGNYIVIDPYPALITENCLPELTQVVKERVELTDLTLFAQLQENDVLFIDSGHTVRTGGDVNYLYLDVLPRLAPGVIVHIHDICLPYDYPRIYFTNPQFRVFWTEAYLLQAFLTYNSQFEILLAMNYLMIDKTEEFKHAFKHYDPEIHKLISGSFWIRRKIDK